MTQPGKRWVFSEDARGCASPAPWAEQGGSTTTKLQAVVSRLDGATRYWWSLQRLLGRRVGVHLHSLPLHGH